MGKSNAATTKQKKAASKAAEKAEKKAMAAAKQKAAKTAPAPKAKAAAKAKAANEAKSKSKNAKSKKNSEEAPTVADATQPAMASKENCAVDDEVLTDYICKYLGDVNHYWVSLPLPAKEVFLRTVRGVEKEKLASEIQMVATFLINQLDTLTLITDDWFKLGLGITKEDLLNYAVAHEIEDGIDIWEMVPEEPLIFKTIAARKADGGPAAVLPSCEKLKAKFAKDRQRQEEQAKKTAETAATRALRVEYGTTKRQASMIQGKLSPILVELAALIKKASTGGSGAISEGAAAALQGLHSLQGELTKRIVSDTPPTFSRSSAEMMQDLFQAKSELAIMKRNLKT